MFINARQRQLLLLQGRLGWRGKKKKKRRGSVSVGSVRAYATEVFFGDVRARGSAGTPHGAAQTPQTVDLIKQCEIN